MGSVNISQVNQYVTRYDIDKNGGLDRAEIAKASLNLLGQEDPNAQVAGQLFATFVQGGSDGQGLFPDFNNNQVISAAELAQLASRSGNTTSIESSDFKAQFGDRFQPGGAGGSIEGLEEIAQGNLDKFNPNNPETFGNSVGTLSGNPEFGAILTGILQIFTLLLQNFSKLFNQQ